MHSETEKISVDERFGLLYESLKDIHSGYVTDVMKTLAFLIIGIGWFVTSEKSRDFFRKSKLARISSLVAAGILGLIHIHASIDVYLLSQKKISLLRSLNYLGSNYYGDLEITATLLATNLLQNMALFAVLIVILYSLKGTAKRREPGHGATSA